MILNFVVSLCLFTSAAISLDAKDFFKICNKDSADLNDCILKSITDLKPSLKKGIPQLKIPSLDPYIIPAISLNTGPITATFIDLKINGISNYKIKSVKASLDKYQIDFEAWLPYLLNEGPYKMNGTILILPIQGDGHSWTNYTDVDVKATIKGSPVKRKGKTFMEITSVKTDFTPKKADFHMDNLFNGNKVLGDTMNRFISENWREFYKETKPAVDAAIGTIFKNLADRVFSKFPLDELLPA